MSWANEEWGDSARSSAAGFVATAYLVSYIGSMKSKTSITLGEDILTAIDRLAGPGVSRSAFIDRVLRAYVRRRARAEAEATDLALLNRHAAQLNAQAADVLEYQASWNED